MNNFKNQFQNKVNQLKELIVKTKGIANDISYTGHDMDKCSLTSSKKALEQVLKDKINELAMTNLKVQKIIMSMLPEDDVEEDDLIEEGCPIEHH